MEDVTPISGAPRKGAPVRIISSTAQRMAAGQQKKRDEVTFNRKELDAILRVYGHRVAEGDWRDYAVDFLKEAAIFSVFRRSSEVPLYRIEKRPKLARRQGTYSVIAPTGLILKRGHDLRQVLRVLEKSRLQAVD